MITIPTLFARYQPLLPGASWRERLISGVGGLFGIAAMALVASIYAPGHAPLYLAAPIGASAVLVFGVPSSPLTQPWPVIGGSIVSMLSGILVMHLFGTSAFAAGLAVGLSIVAMAALRCLHPPGGGYALLPIVAGPASASAAWSFALMPVGINAAILVICGVLFHRFSHHSYPHRPAPMPVATPHFRAEDIDAALEELGESFDVAREDLDVLLERAEHHAQLRVKRK